MSPPSPCSSRSGGSSYAAVTLTGRNIKDSTLTGRDVKDKSLTGADVKDSSLTGRDVRSGSIAAADLDPSLPGQPAQGPQGPQGLQGPQGDQGVPGPVDGFTKAESDARYLPKSTVQVFRVAAGWRAISTGVTASQKTGRTELSRGTSGSMSAVLPLSVPVSLDGKRVRPTAARVCFRQNANTSIGSVGVTIGSGDDPADDVEGQSVAVADQSGCLTIDLKAILVHRNIAPDTALDLHAVASSTGAGFIQLGPADVTLTPDP